MAHVKLHLDKRYSDSNGMFALGLQIAHKGKTRTIPLGTRLKANQWNSATQTVSGVENAKRMQGKLESLVAKAKLYIEANQLEIQSMEIGQLKTELAIVVKKTPQTSDATLERVRHSQSEESTLKNWGRVLMDRALAANRIGRASYYKNSISAFIRFNGGKDLPLIDINERFLEEFKVWAETEIVGVKKAWKPNSTGAYMRAVRGIMNQSIKEKRNFVPTDFQPFRNVGIPTETKEVDSITSIDIAKLRALPLEEGSELWKARARFLFMFNCQGMNFVDLAKLRMSDRVGQFISYERAKTIRKRKNKRIDVALTREACKIWDYFTKGKRPDDLAFDIYDVEEMRGELRARNQATKSRHPGITEMNRRKRALKKLNKNLEVLSEFAGLHKRITTYDARYGWVNAALDANVPEELIGKGLGHSHPGVTRVYFEERHKRAVIEPKLNELITNQ